MPPLSIAARARPALLAAAALLIGCAGLQSEDNFLGFITPYRIEIVQGNVITKEQAALVRPGISRNQVRDLLGSPLVTDIFHTDRWDYVFTIKRQGTVVQRRAVVARFDGDQLKTLELPDDLPSEREFVASISRTSASGQATNLELTDEQRAALPKPPAAKAGPAQALGPARNYPPLEPQ
jgi:outer membrane protein assembly factor BamE